MDIRPYLTDIHILTLTAEQIKKDFAFFSLPVNFSGNKETAYIELFDQIEPHIKKLMETDHQKLLSLLYRVDIKEQEIHRATEYEPSKHLTDLVIKRCLQKVILRKLYS
jgi:hypothetical protein